MKQRTAQAGAALLTAMVIVTLVATLAAAMVWQQWQAVQVEAAERAQTQAQWILNGALDWARLILREDGRNGGPDDLSEPWAVPLSEARLSTFLANDGVVSDDAPDAFLSGTIRDAQARYNLRNVVRGGKVDAKQQAALQRLCEAVGLSSDWAGRIAQGLKTADNSPAEASRGAPGEAPRGDTPPAEQSTTDTAQSLMPPSETQLRWLGLDPKALAGLLPHIVLLPKPTPVNLNTASKEVIAAVLGIDLATAERLVQSRARQPLKAVDDARTVVGAQLELDAHQLSVNSGYFEVTGILRLDQLVVAQRSLIMREGTNVRVLRTERIRNVNTLLQQ
jgi:general secretion pathway protein K